MITRPKNLVHVEMNIEFNFHGYEVLEIDLEHINKEKRSHLTAYEVSFIVKSLIDGMNLYPSGVKSFNDEICSYFVRRNLYKDKSYKLVFCICSDRPYSIGVITLYREKKNKESIL